MYSLGNCLNDCKRLMSDDYYFGTAVQERTQGCQKFEIMTILCAPDRDLLNPKSLLETM